MKNTIQRYRILVSSAIIFWFAAGYTWAQEPIYNLPSPKIKIQQALSTSSESQIGPVLINGFLYFSQQNSEGHPTFKTQKFFDVCSIGLHQARTQNHDKPEKTSFSTDLHDGPISFCESTGELFVTQSDVQSLSDANNSPRRKKVRLKISVYQQVEDAWIFKEEFPFNNPAYSVAHPAISDQGDSLFFASDQPGGHGNCDIYLSIRTNGQWQKPQNLGSPINTKKDEITPFATQGGTLFFASNGHKKRKSYQIYMATPKQSAGYNKPTPLPAPINNRSNNYGFWLHRNEKFAFFVSDRKKKNDQIYMALGDGFFPRFGDPQNANYEMNDIDIKTQQYISALVDQMKSSQFISENVQFKATFEMINLETIPDLKVTFSYRLTNDTIRPGINTFSLSCFTPNKSNPVQVLLQIVEHTLQDYLKPYIAPGKKIDLKILAKPDAMAVFADTQYNDDFDGAIRGNFLINNKLTHISIDENSNISDTTLVFLRAYGMGHYMKTNFKILQTTHNAISYHLAEKSQLQSIEEWAQIEVTIENAFCNF